MKTVSTHATPDVAALVRRHQSAVRSFLLYLGCPRPLLDDLVQETFLSVLSSPFEDRGEASTAAYLRTVARHHFLKAMRRERRQPLVMDIAGAESAWVEYLGEDGGHSYLAALRECLAILRGRTAEVLRLRYGESQRRTAIATRFGLSESGVKSILVRARRRLRDCVERKRS